MKTVVFFACAIMAGMPGHAAACSLQIGQMGEDSGVTGIITSVEEGLEDGETDIGLDDPCDVFITWAEPLPGNCQVGRQIKAVGFNFAEYFLADTLSCR
jgi:hypothetical protein